MPSRIFLPSDLSKESNEDIALPFLRLKLELDRRAELLALLGVKVIPAPATADAGDTHEARIDLHAEIFAVKPIGAQ